MPSAWQSADVWGTGDGRRYSYASWGYHSVPLIGYDADYFYCVTWGRLQRLTHAAIERYCDEAFGLIDPVWLGEDNTTPTGLDLAALEADLA